MGWLADANPVAAMGSTDLDEDQPAPTMLRKELEKAKVVIVSEK